MTAGAQLDPKVKRWETGLVCESCKRKAVALNLFKPGDIWDRKRLTRKFIGKRLCCSCTTGLVRVASLSYDPGALWRESLPFVLAGLFFGSGIGGAVTGFLNLRTISLILWLMFFLTMVAFLVGLAVEKIRRKPTNEPLPAFVPPTISLESFYATIEN